MARPRLVVTTENVPGHRVIRVLGQCFGVMARGRGLGGNFVASLRSLVGGEITDYPHMLEKARHHALDRMVQNDAAMGANRVGQPLAPPIFGGRCWSARGRRGGSTSRSPTRCPAPAGDDRPRSGSSIPTVGRWSASIATTAPASAAMCACRCGRVRDAGWVEATA